MATIPTFADTLGKTIGASLLRPSPYRGLSTSRRKPIHSRRNDLRSRIMAVRNTAHAVPGVSGTSRHLSFTNYYAVKPYGRYCSTLTARPD
jgi:hypothetical protein